MGMRGLQKVGTLDIDERDVLNGDRPARRVAFVTSSPSASAGGTTVSNASSAV